MNDFAYFRKEFKVRGELASVQLYVSGHHYFHVYLNGAKIGGYGTPAPTNPYKRKFYMEYDVGDQLNQGMNCITADVHYLGGGGQNTVDGLPGFRLELHLTYLNGKKQVVKTNSSWDTLIDMPHITGTPYQQNRRISAIEDYDARKWDVAWRYIGWESTSTAKTSKAKLTKIAREDWPMVRQSIPEGAIEEELSLTKLNLTSGSDDEEVMPQVFDVGRIVSGWPRFKLKGFEGAIVRFRYSEDLDEQGRVKHNVSNEDSEHYYDQYTMRGDSLEEWQPDFSYKAFRYVEVTGYPLPIEPGISLTVCVAYTAIEYVGNFRCSDEHLNKMYEACMRTQKNNTLGQIVDCPHREQAQYIADTDLQAEALLYNFNSQSVIEKTLSDFADAQLEDGTFPFVAPSNSDNPDFKLQIPEWDLHYATLLWKLYEASGELSLLRAYFGTLHRMVDYFLGILDSETGLVPLDKGWHISDWPYPSVEHKGEFLTVQQIKLLQAIRITSAVATLIGEEKKLRSYLQQAEQLSCNIIKHLYNHETKCFRDSSDSAQNHQGVTAIALYAGVVPDEDREQAIAYVASKEWECRTVLSLPLLRMLFENKREAEAFAILSSREYPGWGYMIAQGAKTMWEGWEDVESHSHAWNGYPARLFQEYIVGIRSEAPGFTKAVIRPFIPDELSFAEALVWTIQGSLFVRWEKTVGGGIRVNVKIPLDVQARLEIRFGKQEVIKELGHGDQEFTLI
ncbi:family 78 glycoside hydrolase catalytic domain [Candidatus Pristimantibacillus sp. PTI5]|uniref:family 78 glycoside hydrolase catalytic domain n=1 Tax=Candidatus Pristimantibacillus sp. PTI5 TaxID=3400422 RepID=UPI003B0189E0